MKYFLGNRKCTANRYIILNIFDMNTFGFYDIFHPVLFHFGPAH